MSPVPGNNRQDPHDPDGEDISIADMDTNIIIAASSSSDSAGEDEEEDSGYQGYQMLPQDAEQVEEHEEEEDDTHITMETEPQGAVGGSHGNSQLDQTIQHSLDSHVVGRGHVPSYLQTPNTEKTESAERRSVWNESRLHPGEPMDDDQLNKIKSAMQGFNLPMCQVPDWARLISEDEWKSQLFSRVHGQKSHILPTAESSQTVSEDDDIVEPPAKRIACSLDVEEEEEKCEEDTKNITPDENTERSTEER